MQLYNNVYIPDMITSDEGRECLNGDDANFVITDEYLAELETAGIALDHLIADILKTKVVISGQNEYPFSQDLVHIRAQYPAISDVVVSNYEELDMHMRISMAHSDLCGATAFESNEEYEKVYDLWLSMLKVPDEHVQQ